MYISHLIFLQLTYLHVEKHPVFSSFHGSCPQFRYSIHAEGASHALRTRSNKVFCKQVDKGRDPNPRFVILNMLYQMICLCTTCYRLFNIDKNQVRYHNYICSVDHNSENMLFQYMLPYVKTCHMHCRKCDRF